jgi:Domain of unknown function (DUF4277)
MEREELDKLDFVIKTVGSLPLLRDFLARMDLGEMIDRHCPLAAQAELSCGQVAELLVANRLRAPKPLSKVAQWASDAGVEAVFGMPAERRNDDRLGRVVEILGQPAVVLTGEMALHSAQECRLGVEQLHWDLTTSSWEGAYEAAPDTVATPGEGGQSKDAQEGQAHAKKAIKVGLTVANDGQGPLPISDEPLDGNASGSQVTLANITHLKEQRKRDRSIRITDRGCQRAKMLAHSLAHGFDTMAPLTWKTTIEKLVRAALAAGTVLQPLAYVPVSQQPKDPAQREGYRAFELPYQVYDQRRAYPVRLIVVKSEGQGNRAPKVRQRHMAWREGRLKPWQERVGQPRWTKKRLQNRIKKVWQQYPEGQW